MDNVELRFHFLLDVKLPQQKPTTLVASCLSNYLSNLNFFLADWHRKKNFGKCSEIRVKVGYAYTPEQGKQILDSVVDLPGKNLLRNLNQILLVSSAV